MQNRRYIVLWMALAIMTVLHIILPLPSLLNNGALQLCGADAYYHMRLADNLLTHFPHRIFFDPYLAFPDGPAAIATHSWPPFFDWLIGGLALLLGAGCPGPTMVDWIGALLPALFGILTIFPVYLIGRELGGVNCGLWAALLLATLPGDFLSRTMFGFADHHAAEIFFTAVIMTCLLLSFQSRPLFYGLLAGVSLGIYLLTWLGGLIFCGVLFAYFIVQSLTDQISHTSQKQTVLTRATPATHLRFWIFDFRLPNFRTIFSCFLSQRSTFQVLITGTATFGTAFAICFLFLPQNYLGSAHPYFFSISLGGMAAFLGLMTVIKRIISQKSYPRYSYPAALLAFGGLFFVFTALVYPAVLQSALIEWQNVKNLNKTILETRPLLFPHGSFTLRPAWGNFAAAFFTALISYGWMMFEWRRHPKPAFTLILVWSAAAFGLALFSQRYAYYLAVNVAVLTGYLAGKLCGSIKAVEAKGRGVVIWNQKTGAGGQPAASGRRGRQILLLKCALILGLVYVPNFVPAWRAARNPRFFTPSRGWLETLAWLRQNSPEPFNDPDFYYRYYDALTGKPFAYPDSAYSVMAWWDYGHWIIRLARRIPVCTPFQSGAAKAAEFFIAAADEAAQNVLRNAKGKYVIVNRDIIAAKFHGLVTLAGKKRSDFYEVYYQNISPGVLSPVILYYPAYYQTMAVRLFCFNAGAFKAPYCPVFEYSLQDDGQGGFKKIVSYMKNFPSYESARTFLSDNPAGRFVIASPNPFLSPVSLPALSCFYPRYIYPAPDKEAPLPPLPEIKVFEFQEKKGQSIVPRFVPIFPFIPICYQSQLYPTGIKPDPAVPKSNSINA